MKKGLTASSARIVLALFLLIILAAMVAGSYFAYSFLSTTSKEVADMQLNQIGRASCRERV